MLIYFLYYCRKVSFKNKMYCLGILKRDIKIIGIVEDGIILKIVILEVRV